MGSAPDCHLSPHLPAVILLASFSMAGSTKLAAGCLKLVMDIQLFLAALPGVPNVPSAGVAGVSKMYLLTNCPPMPAAQWVAYVGLARGGWGSYLRRRRTEVNIRIGQLSSELLLDESDRGHPGSLGLVEERGDEQARDPDEANEEARLEHAASCDRHLSRALDLPGHIRAAQRTGERANGSKEARTSPRILPPTPMAAMVSPLTESAAPGLPESSRRQASRDWGVRACLRPGHVECPLLRPGASPLAAIASPATGFAKTPIVLFAGQSQAGSTGVRQRTHYPAEDRYIERYIIS